MTPQRQVLNLKMKVNLVPYDFTTNSAGGHCEGVQDISKLKSDLTHFHHNVEIRHNTVLKTDLTHSRSNGESIAVIYD